MSTEAQIKALLNEEIDVAFVHGPVNIAELISINLFSELLVVALPPNHYLASQKQIELRSLALEAFVLCPKQVKPELYTQILNLCQQAGFQPKIVQEASPPEVLIGLVESGMGISLVAAGAENRHKTQVIYRPLAEPVPSLEIAITWRKEKNSLVLDQFLDIVKQFHQVT